MIPKSFTIFGEKYKVKQVVKVDSEDSFGEFNPETNIIKIKKGLQQDQKESVYYHELIHCLTHVLGYATLYTDEVFTDTMGKALHQILKTSK
jgi:hypothetical protein